MRHYAFPLFQSSNRCSSFQLQPYGQICSNRHLTFVYEPLLLCRNGETAVDRGHTEARHPPPSGSYQSEATYSSSQVKQEYNSSRTPDSAGGGSYAEGSAGGISASASEVVVAGAGRAGAGGGHPVKDSPSRGVRVKDSPRGGQRVRESPRAVPRVRASPRARDTPRDTASDGGPTTTSRRIVANVAKAPKAIRSATAPKERMSAGAGPAAAAVGGNDGGGVAKQGGVAGEGLVSRNQGGGGGSYPASQGGSEPRYAASRDRDIAVHSPHASLKAGGAQKKILPPSQRYNFYRYFGMLLKILYVLSDLKALRSKLNAFLEKVKNLLSDDYFAIF